MTPQRFDEIVTRAQSDSVSVLCRKSEEYGQGDRLANFKAAAGLLGASPAQAAWGMAVKHIVSVQDVINGRIQNTDAMRREKIGDAINYLVLIEAALVEQEEKS